MNILYLTNKFPFPPKDGGAIAMLNIITGMAELGDTISVLSMNTKKHFFKTQNLPEDLKNKISFYTTKINTNISIPVLLWNLLFSKKPYNAIRFKNKKFENKLKDILHNKSFDLIQIEGLYLLPYIQIIRKYSSAKIAYRAHNIEFEIWERIYKNENNRFKKLYFKILKNRLIKFEKSLINKYDFIFPITNRDAQQLNNLGNNKPLFTLPTGLNFNEYTPSLNKTGIDSLCYIGALDWIPNQEALKWFINNIWKDIKNTHNDISFYVAGRNAPEWLIQILITNEINYKGEVADAKDFLLKNGIMIVPLLSGSGMRIKIIEGMALGKTIITSSIGCEGIDAQPNKNIIIANTKQEYFQAIDYCIKNPIEYAEIGENATIFARQHFDNIEILKKLRIFLNKNIVQCG